MWRTLILLAAMAAPASAEAPAPTPFVYKVSTPLFQMKSNGVWLVKMVQVPQISEAEPWGCFRVKDQREVECFYRTTVNGIEVAVEQSILLDEDNI